MIVKMGFACRSNVLLLRIGRRNILFNLRIERFAVRHVLKKRTVENRLAFETFLGLLHGRRGYVQ